MGFLPTETQWRGLPLMSDWQSPCKRAIKKIYHHSNERANMKYLFFIVLLILAIITAGCVGENKNNISTSTQTTITTGQRYVTEVTPFLTITPTNIPHRTFSPVTPIPEDLTCLIYSTKQSFVRNKTAFSFNLKNPPVYINYSVSDYPYITEVNSYKNRTGSKDEGTITYQTINPGSFFEIIVRDKSTGEIYLQDGFGKEYGYHMGTLKLIKRGDLLFEMSGNMITADVKIWVKPIGNFDDLSKFDYKECIYWV